MLSPPTWKKIVIMWKEDVNKPYYGDHLPYISSVQFSCSVVSDSLWPHELQHAKPPCPSPTPTVYPNSCLLSRWCRPAISSSVVPFSSCPQSLPASESFPMSQLFAWGCQNIGVSALVSVLPKDTQDWSPLGWTGWISLQSKGLLRVFSNTIVQKHHFFGTIFLNFCFSWSCSATCNIIVPQSGVKPEPPSLTTQTPNHLTTREILPLILLKFLSTRLISLNKTGV